MKENGIEYSRTIKATHGFELLESPLAWDPTCHFRDEDIHQLAAEFLQSKDKTDMLFYIWGHSYELVTEEDWQEFEELCTCISGHSDIYYCTNVEALDYMIGGKERWER